MTTRTDCHRPADINPDDYTLAVCYSTRTMTTDGWPCKPVNVDRVVELMRTERFAHVHPGINRCDICGAVYLDGEVWRHEPTGEHITVGHICAETAGLRAGKRWAELQGQKRAATAKARAEANRRAERVERIRNLRAFVRSNPELTADLRDGRGHGIIDDIRRKLGRFGSLTDRQAALVRKLAREERERAVEANRPSAPAPEGRAEVDATILRAYYKETAFGTVAKVMLRVDTPAGSWRAWGTLPRAIEDEVAFTDGETFDDLAGRVLHFAASFAPKADDPSFAFFKRPTRAALVAARAA